MKYKLLQDYKGYKKGSVIETNDPFGYFYTKDLENVHMPSHHEIFLATTSNKEGEE